MDVAPGGQSAEALAWTREMLAFLRTIDPYARPITTSFASLAANEAVLKDDLVDFLSPHIYRPDLPKRLVALSETFSKYNKPFFVGEFGRGWTADVDLEDFEGAAFRGALWSTLMTPAAGAPLAWWWDIVIVPRDFHRYMNAASRFVKDEDRRGVRLTAILLDLPTTHERTCSLVGLVSEHSLHAYLFDPQMGLHPQRQLPPLLPMDATLTLQGFLDGEYLLEVWDTRNGEVISSRRLNARDGRVALPLPASEVDFAVKLKKVNYQAPAVERFEMAEPQE